MKSSKSRAYTRRRVAHLAEDDRDWIKREIGEAERRIADHLRDVLTEAAQMRVLEAMRGPIEHIIQ